MIVEVGVVVGRVGTEVALEAASEGLVAADLESLPPRNGWEQQSSCGDVRMKTCCEVTDVASTQQFQEIFVCQHCSCSGALVMSEDRAVNCNSGSDLPCKMLVFVCWKCPFH